METDDVIRNALDVYKLPYAISKWYHAQLKLQTIEYQKSKAKAIILWYKELDEENQQKIRELLIDIYKWHIHHIPVKTKLNKYLYVAAIMLVPLKRCPYLESINVYDYLK